MVVTPTPKACQRDHKKQTRPPDWEQENKRGSATGSAKPAEAATQKAAAHTGTTRVGQASEARDVSEGR